MINCSARQSLRELVSPISPPQNVAYQIELIQGVHQVEVLRMENEQSTFTHAEVRLRSNRVIIAHCRSAALVLFKITNVLI